MRIEGGQESGNVEDRRGLRPVAAGGGVLALVVMAVAYLVTGDANVAKKAGQVAGQVQGGGQQQGPAPGGDPKDVKFARQVLGLTEAVWGEQFPQLYRGEYQKPGLVIFDNQVDSEGCGIAPSAVGPFYCPASKKVFLDPTFFDELASKLKGSKAEFSNAYVVAHEVGHHVQNLLGYNRQVDRFEKGGEGKNAGIRLELQADYLAGVWAKLAQQKGLVLERGDLEEAVKTANAIGDDRIAKASGRGWVSPESFTHGRADQRVKAFTKGFQSGDASKPALDYYFNPRANPLEL